MGRFQKLKLTDLLKEYLNLTFSSLFLKNSSKCLNPNTSKTHRHCLCEELPMKSTRRYFLNYFKMLVLWSKSIFQLMLKRSVRRHFALYNFNMLRVFLMPLNCSRISDSLAEIYKCKIEQPVQAFKKIKTMDPHNLIQITKERCQLQCQ